MERVAGVVGERLMKNGEGRIPRKVDNLNITQTATSGCEQRVVANCNEWLRTMSGC